MSEKPTAKDVFLSAIEIKVREQRDAFVAGACRGDASLFEEVVALLDAHYEKDSWLDPRPNPARGEGQPTASLEPPERLKNVTAGSQIGNYKVLEQIGAGGMGIVFMAEQLRPIRRKVALKIIKPGMDSSQVVARFEAERQALALMDHPNIAHVLDAGATESGRPYFVMELVRGIPITEYCDQSRLSTQQRLKLFTTVCQAVQHAHNKGIIHRDIKPSNVLVTLHDGVPVPKIIDFGVAKATSQQLTDRTLFTSYAQFVGTPLYMSPEQAEMSGLDVDTRSDIYSLGVLLYELLTGTTPFDRARLHQAALDEVRRIIREEEPPRPSTRVSSLGNASINLSMQRSTDPVKLKQLLLRELDWVVMKTLEKDRTRRYETVNQLAIEIGRYLDGRPVEACPPSTIYQLSKFASRHRTAVGVAAAFLLIILGATVLSLGLYAQARRARDWALAAQSQSQHERDRALGAERSAARHLSSAIQEKERADLYAHELKQRLYDYSIIKASSAYNARDTRALVSLLSECLPEQRGWEWSFLNRQAGASRRLELPGKMNWEYAITPDMTRVVLVDGEGSIRCVKFSDGSLLWSQKSDISIPSSCCVSSSGDQVVVTGSRRMPRPDEAPRTLEEGAIEMFNVASGQRLWIQKSISTTTFLPAFCRDDTQLLVTAATSGTSSEIQLLSTTDGNLIWSTPALTIAQAIMNKAGTRIFISETHHQRVEAPSVLRCIDTATKSQLWKCNRADEVSSIGLSPDETELIATGNALSLILFDTKSGERKQTYKSPSTETGLVILGCATGNYMATASPSGHFVIWDWQTKRPIESGNAVARGRSMQLTSDGSQIAWLLNDANALQVRPTQATSDSLTLIGHKSGFKGARFLDADQLCSVGNEGAWRIWHTTTGQELAAAPIDAGGLEMETAPDARWVATATTAGTKVWDRSTGKILQDWRRDGQTWFVKRNATGTMLATAGQQGILRIYEAQDADGGSPWSTKVPSPSLESKTSVSIHGLALSADGLTAYTLSSPGCEVIAWDTESGGRHVLRQSQPGVSGRTAELSFDGRYLAIGVERTVEVWNLDTQALSSVLRDSDSDILSLTFDRTGSRLLAGTANGTILLWNLNSQERLLSYKAHGSYVVCLSMSPDNTTLASSSHGGEIKLWETRLLTPEATAERERVQRATARANELLVRHRTPKAALESLLRVEAPPEDLMPTVMNILQARMNAPVNLNALAAAANTSGGAVAATRSGATIAAPSRGNRDGMNASVLKQRIDAALAKDLSDVFEPTTELPDAVASGNWNSLCRTLVQKSTFGLTPAELIELLQQIEDNGDAPHYIHYLQGVAHLQMSQWELAEAKMSQAIAMVPTKSPLWFTYAFRLCFLQAFVGKWDGYQTLCATALDDFKDSDEPLILERLAKMCLFSKQGSSAMPSAIAVVDRALSETEFLAVKVFVRLTKGIADLRAEKFDSAFEHFSYVIQTGVPGSQEGHEIIVATAQLYSAIALHRLGRSPEAERHLEESEQAIRTFPTNSGWWPDWMLASVVLEEAEELIARSTSSAPSLGRN